MINGWKSFNSDWVESRTRETNKYREGRTLETYDEAERRKLENVKWKEEIWCEFEGKGGIRREIKKGKGWIWGKVK